MLITLYSAIGPNERALLEQRGWKRWPVRPPEQAIFSPVTNEQYAVEIAKKNAAESGSGYVTRFRVRSPFMERYTIHCVGAEHQTEWRIPAERLEELNDNIVGWIEIVAEFHAGEGGATG